MNQGSSFIEIVAAVVVLLLAFFAVFVALPVFAEYVRAVTP